MSAPVDTLRVRLLRVGAPASPGDPGRDVRVRRLLADDGERALDDALGDVGWPDGHWCVRRLVVPVGVDLDRPGARPALDWARVVVTALRRALDSPDGDVVHFPRRRDAVADLVARVADGDTARAWAWASLGLIGRVREPGGPEVLDALRARPELVVAVLVRVLAGERGGPRAVALDRMLGPEGWRELGRVAAGACGAVTVPSTVSSTAAPPAAPTGSVRARSVLARALDRVPGRPDPVTAHGWATLAVAESDPSALRWASAPARVATVAASWTGDRTEPRPDGRTHRSPAAGAVGSPPRPAPGGDSRSAAAPYRTRPSTPDGLLPRPVSPARTAAPVSAADRTDLDGAASGEDLAPAQGGAPGAAVAAVEEPTAWAGLVFLLATAHDAGLPDVAVTSGAATGGPVGGALSARPLWWTLHAVACALVPDAASDPAALAVAGLGLDERELLAAADPPTADETAAVDRIADRWASVTAHRVSDPSTGTDDDRDTVRDVVRAVAARPGTVRTEPGRTEIVLDLAGVDTAVRCAALDVDPGWVPWLGRVVRYRYV